MEKETIIKKLEMDEYLDSDSEGDEEVKKIILESESRSSSSSEDEYEIETDHILSVLHLVNNKSKRTCIRNYVEVTLEKYTDEEFGKHFKIRKSLYRDLCGKFGQSQEYQRLDTRKAYSPEVHIVLFLWFATHEGVSFSDMSDRFDLSDCFDRHQRWPNDAEQQETIQYMHIKTGLQGAIGALDGTHIKIIPPKNSKDEYVDRKNVKSLCLQAICNEKRKFIDIFVGYSGSVHDSRVFKNSDIYLKLPALCGNNFILADSDYRCSRYVITPYRDNGRLSRNHARFNRKLSSGRVIIEHSFGILKQSFRQQYYCKLKGMEKICHFVQACCVLHNLCGEEFIDLNEVNDNEGGGPENCEEKDFQEGSSFRDQLFLNMFS